MKYLQQASQFIRSSRIIIIGAGAGMGKDSGLPDFRGNQGFWNNYPPYRKKFNFYDCANPNFLQRQPNLFWGFYGTRLKMYRQLKPHNGFNILLDLQNKFNKKIFALTSNVDGHFQKAGFKQNQIYQIHGNIHYLQCDNCLKLIQNNFQPQINYEKMSAQNLPFCLQCKNQIMRPNVLMFSDYTWLSQRSDQQEKHYKKFLAENLKSDEKICLIQIGAGTAVPTVRNILQRIYYNHKNTSYIRINPDNEQNQYEDKNRFVHLKIGALQAIKSICYKQ